MDARRTVRDDDEEEEGAVGMKVDLVVEDVVEEKADEVEGEETAVKKTSKPKTKKQRRKAAVLLVEVCSTSMHLLHFSTSPMPALKCIYSTLTSNSSLSLRNDTEQH